MTQEATTAERNTEADTQAVPEATTPQAHPDQPKRDRGSWQKRIEKAYSKALACYIQTGKELNDAQQELAPDEFSKMVNNDLPFGWRHALRMMRVANHPVFANTTYESQLPPNLETVNRLARLDETKAKALLHDGKIHPTLTRTEATDLVEEHTGQRPKADHQPNPLSVLKNHSGQLLKNLSEASDTDRQELTRYLRQRDADELKTLQKAVQQALRGKPKADATTDAKADGEG